MESKRPANYKHFFNVIKSGDFDAIYKLIDEGYDLNKFSDEGKTAIMYIASGKNKLSNLILKTLIEHGAKPYLTNPKDGKTALIYSVINGNCRLINTLAEKNRSIFMRDEDGRTALMYSVMYDTRVCFNDIMNYYFMYNEDVTQEDYDDFSALSFAFLEERFFYFDKLLNWYKKHRVNLSEKEKEYINTKAVVLSYITMGDLEMFDFLVSQGLNINLVIKEGDFKGLYPLDVAIERNQKNIIDYLLEKGAKRTFPITHPLIGIDEGYGDPLAPYHIDMSKNFVEYTQYDPLPSNDDDLKAELSNRPRPHLVYACPIGHLHSSLDCGVPTEVSICGMGEEGDCSYYVGGINHFLVPGNYIVYHDGYEYAKIWYGEFPVYDYQTYLKMVEQYNISASKVQEIQLIDPVEEKPFTNIARPITDEDDVQDSACSLCGGEAEYIFPECGHLICEECLTNARGGNIENINIGGEENFKARKCGTCGKQFRFKGASTCLIS